jgi:uncharacterized lipoprotein YmbA
MRALVIAGALLLTSCAGGQSMSWASLASEAKPTFEEGPCGTEVKWVKPLEVTDELEIVGEVTIRPKCKQ